MPSRYVFLRYGKSSISQVELSSICLTRCNKLGSGAHSGILFYCKPKSFPFG